MGIGSCLKRARERVCWPGMSRVKDWVTECTICESKQKRPQREPLLLKEVPGLPWESVAVDLLTLTGRFPSLL